MSIRPRLIVLAVTAVLPAGVSFGQFTLSPLSSAADRASDFRVPAAPETWAAGLNWMCAPEAQGSSSKLDASEPWGSAVRTSELRALAAVADADGTRTRCAADAAWAIVRFHGWLVVSIARPQDAGGVARAGATLVIDGQPLCEVNACPLTFSDAARASVQAGLDLMRQPDSTPRPGGEQPGGSAAVSTGSLLSAAAL